jgi:O-antigen/teichoic acid export membrane protein
MPIPVQDNAANPRWTAIRKCAVSLIDQSLVSGIRFLTTILIGSFCGAAELGNYAIGFSILMVLHAVQMSVFSRPYTIYVHRQTDGQRAALAGSVLLHFAVFCAFSSAALSVAAGLLGVLQIESSLTPILWTLAAAAPVILLRDHARQFYFAHLHVGAATTLDVIATIIQLLGLLYLAWTGQLTAATAIAVMAVACAAAAMAWMWMARDMIRFEMARVLSDFRRHWKVGRWDCASELTFTVQIQGVTWLIALFLGSSSVGVYAACMTIIQLANPLLLGMNSVLVPKTAKVFAQNGLSALRTMVQTTTLVIGTMTAMFAGVALIWGPEILRLLYRGNGFVIDDVVIAVLLLGLCVEVLGMGCENALWAIERHELNFQMNVLGFIATFGSAVVLIPRIGVAGAAVAFFAGRLATSAAQCWAYRHAMAAMEPSHYARSEAI